MSDPSLRLDEAAILSGIGKLPALPVVAVELVQSLDDDRADTARLVGLIAHDQALAARVLRVANSSFYGLAGKVQSIRDAIVVVGLRGIRSLAIAAAVSGAFGRTGADRFDFKAFWCHSVGTALCAQELAKHCGSNAEIAFAAGLLHDIGRLALATAFPSHHAAIVAVCDERDCVATDAESELIGLDHARIGELLTGHWSFPPALSAAIGAHHAPTQGDTLAGIVHLANACAHALDLCDACGNTLVPPVDDQVWARIAPSADELQGLFAAVEVQFGCALDLLPRIDE